MLSHSLFNISLTVPTQFDENSPLHPVEPLLFYQPVFLLIITGTDNASNL